MTDPDVVRRRAQKHYEAPFASLLTTKASASAEERTAHAMEYAAAQLGEIRRMLAEDGVTGGPND